MAVVVVVVDATVRAESELHRTIGPTAMRTTAAFDRGIVRVDGRTFFALKNCVGVARGLKSAPAVFVPEGKST